MEINETDIESYVTDGIADKDGILLLELACIPVEKRQTFFSDNDETYTVRVALKGNILAFYDVGSTKLKFFLILERVVAQFVEPTSSLPYAFVLASCAGGAALETFRFSAFSEEDRTEWVQALAQCSHELLNARMLTLNERVNNVLKRSDYTRLESELKSKLRSDFGGKVGSSNALYQTDPLQPNDDSNLYSALYDNLIMKKLKIETGSGLIRCREHMSEPKITLTLPINLIRMHKENVERIVDQFECIIYLPTNWDAVRLHHVKRLRELSKRYDNVLAFLNEYCGPPFKASQCKDRAEYNFMPTNLHIQRFSVLNNNCPVGDQQSSSSPHWNNYDFTTCGAFTAYALSYANGGVRKISHRLRHSLLSDEQQYLWASCCDWSKLQSCNAELSDLQTRLKQLNGSLLKYERDFDKTVKLSAEVRTLAEQLRQMRDDSSWWPSVNDAVDQLTRFCDAYYERLSVGMSHSVVDRSTKTGVTVNNNGLEHDNRFKLETIESQREDFEAEVACLVTKVENLSHLEWNRKLSTSSSLDESGSSFNYSMNTSNEREAWSRNLSTTAYGVVVRLEKFVRTLCHGYLFAFLKIVNAPDAVAAYYDLLYRQSVVYSQMLTAVSATLLNQLWMCDVRDVSHLTQAWCTCGALVVIHSYLTCYHNEKGMLEDLADAIRFLRQNCSFRLIRSFANVKSCHPLVDGNWSCLKITLPVPLTVFDALPDALRKGDWFYATPIFLSVGINHEETIAHRLGDTSFEFELHESAFKTYKTYVQRWVKEEYGSGRSIQEANRLLDEICRRVASKQSKNVDLLHSSTELCRCLNGSLIICCKSGKDRTAMAVTLEEVFLLTRYHNLPDSHVQATLDIIRREGTRLENTLKNIGVRRYAFTGLQLNLLPVFYRPPKGCYGSVHT